MLIKLEEKGGRIRVSISLAKILDHFLIFVYIQPSFLNVDPKLWHFDVTLLENEKLKTDPIVAQIELGKKSTSLDGWVNWLELSTEQIMAKNLRLLKTLMKKRCTFIKKTFLDYFYNKGLFIFISKLSNNES
jgi:hypothetical protein